MRMGAVLFHRTAADGRPQPAPRTIQKSTSVFEDNVTKFKEESTPVQFSTATSLSSLTIDDHEDVSGTQIKVSFSFIHFRKDGSVIIIYFPLQIREMYFFYTDLNDRENRNNCMVDYQNIDP